MTQETKTIDGTQYTTGYTYDGADRMTVVTYPGGETATQAYNGPFTNTLTSSVSGNIVTGTEHNQLGATSQIDFNNGLRSIFHYHGIDSLDSGDPNNYWGKLYKVRTYKTSDSSDRLLYKYWWDANGNLTQRYDGIAGTEYFTYDALDRIITSPYDTYAYNAIGNITSINGSSYTYGTKPHALTTYNGWTFAYDANGSMTMWKTADYTLVYDVENRMTGNWNGFHAYTYDGDGNRTKREYGLIDRDGFGQDTNGTALSTHKTAIRQWNWSTNTIGWTVEGNKAAFNGSSASQAAYIDFTKSDVIVEADYTISNSANVWGGLVFRYSDSNNYMYLLIAQKDSPIVDVLVRKVVSGSATDLGYTRIGLTAGTTHALKVRLDGSSIKAYVDGTEYVNVTETFNQTATRHGLFQDSSGVSDPRWDNFQVSWIYSGNHMLDTVVYPNKYMEKNVTQNQTTLYYYFGGQMVALKKGSTLEYLHADHLGSTSVTTDTSGAVTSRTRYKAFGEVLTTGGQETTGTLNTEHKFTGQIFDTGTDLYFYNARYYDRTLRRFTQADTIVQDMSNPQHLNRYSYVANNPLANTDPTGHCIKLAPCPLNVFRTMAQSAVSRVTSLAVTSSHVVASGLNYSGQAQLQSNLSFASAHAAQGYQAAETLASAWEAGSSAAAKGIASSAASETAESGGINLAIGKLTGPAETGADITGAFTATPGFSETAGIVTAIVVTVGTGGWAAPASPYIAVGVAMFLEAYGWSGGYDPYYGFVGEVFQATGIEMLSLSEQIISETGW